MLKQRIECTFNNMDINKEAISLNSSNRALKRFADYHETINRISKGRLFINNNRINSEAENKIAVLNSKIFKFKVYKNKCAKMEKNEKLMKTSIADPSGLNNKKLFEIVKLKASLDETKQRFYSEFSCENDVLYNKILKLSDRLDKIFEASIKIKE
jgi:hypothetical protein